MKSRRQVVPILCALFGVLVTLVAPVGAEHPKVKSAASFVRVGTRKVSCGRTTPTYRSGRGSRCRPARDVFPEFHKTAVLEYGPNSELGSVAGKRHLVAVFEDGASDCDVIRMLCAVRGDLVEFMPKVQLGVIAFPWVQTTDDLAAAMRSLQTHRVVGAATYDGEIQALQRP